MQYGILFLPRPAATVVEKARLAEELGYDLFGLADSQTLFRELHTCLGAVAAGTEEIAIGSTITNPVTRHPMVTASAMATIDELSGGERSWGWAAATAPCSPSGSGWRRT